MTTIGKYTFEDFTEEQIEEMYSKSLVFNTSLRAAQEMCESSMDDDMEMSGFTSAVKNDIFLISGTDKDIVTRIPPKENAVNAHHIGDDILFISRIQSDFPQDMYAESLKHIVYHIMPTEWDILEEYTAIIGEMAKHFIRINTEDDLLEVVNNPEKYGKLSRKVKDMCAEIGQRGTGLLY